MLKTLLITILLLLPIQSMAQFAPEPTLDYNSETQTVRLEGPTTRQQAMYLNFSIRSGGVKKLLVSGPGGDFMAGLDIAEKVRKHGIKVYVVGQCVSACTLPYLASPRGYILPKASVLIHGPYFMYVPTNWTIGEIGRNTARGYLLFADALQEWGHHTNFLYYLLDATNECEFLEMRSWEDVQKLSDKRRSPLVKRNLCPVPR